MSNVNVEIFDFTHTLEIETSVVSNTNNIEIISSTDRTVEILSGNIVGSVSLVYAVDVIGLDQYIDNFLDTANIDCGTP